jgi:hypothetical protein
MGASSVTGVGQGSADKAGQRGSEHLFVGVEKLIGTRVVESGYVLCSTTVVVTLPTVLPGVWQAPSLQAESSPADTTPPTQMDYAIFVNAFNSATATYVSAIGTSGGYQTFTITGPSSGQVFWEVVRTSNSLVSAFPTQF